MRADWGGDDGLLRDPWPSEALPPERLPAVLDACARGWYLAPDAPLWCFLPAVWPAHARGWVPDRSVPVTRLRREGRPEVTIAWSAWDHAEADRDLDEQLLAAGVPARPRARLWLLRPPPGAPDLDLDTVVGRLVVDAEAAGVPVTTCAALVAWTAATVERWFAPVA